MPRQVKEKATFVIRTADGNRLGITSNGSVIGGMVEAFSMLAPERRLTLLDRLNRRQAELLAREAERAATEGTTGT